MKENRLTAFLFIIVLNISNTYSKETLKPIGDALSVRFGLHTVQGFDVYVHNNTVHMLALGKSSAEGTSLLRYVRSEDNGRNFSDPVAVGLDQAIQEIAHRHDIAVAADGDRIIAMWNAGGGSGWGGSGPISTAISSDGGKSFHPGPNPADDGSNDGHAFYDLAANDKNLFHAIWLDSRSGQPGLRYARSVDGGDSWESNQSLDDVTCECCWNRLLAVEGNIVLTIYRDKDPRDMALARTTDSGTTWKQMGHVGNFGWEFDGCPHVGGSLARNVTSERTNLHALTWTGKTDNLGLWVQSSYDDGQSWNSPIRLGSEFARYADIAHNNKQLFAVWNESDSQGMHTVKFSTSSDDGANWTDTYILKSSPTLLHYPRVVSIDNIFLVLWHQLDIDDRSSVGVQLITNTKH